MAKATFVAPQERVDDLTQWSDVNDVDMRLRDLPASFGLLASDLGLERGTEELIRQFKNPDNNTQRAEATRRLASLQLIVLNLMLRSSGYTGAPMGSPVKEWDLRLLVGDDTQINNFGNVHMQSRMPEDSRYAEPVSPGEGWWYRMIDHEDNFLVVLRSLRYYDPAKKHGPDYEEVRQRPRTQWALKLVKVLTKEDTYQEEDAPPQE